MGLVILEKQLFQVHGFDAIYPVKGDVATGADRLIYKPDEMTKVLGLLSMFFSEGTASNVTFRSKTSDGDLSGTVSTTSGNAVITGVGTTFTTDFKVDDDIKIVGVSQLTVQTVDSDTQITATGNADATVAGAQYHQIRDYVVTEQAANQGISDKLGNGVYFILQPGRGLYLNPSATLTSFLAHIGIAKNINGQARTLFSNLY